jgi:predicted signal transduction protein with EAL and GGDEF domain
VIAGAEPDLIKMDREIVVGLPRQNGCVAVLEALTHLASRIGAQVVAEGVELPVQLATLRQYGVGIAQGNLMGPPSRRPLTYLPSSGMLEFQVPVSPAPSPSLPGARITTFAHPALTLPISATAEEVRNVLRDRPAVTGVVLVDDDGRPHYTLDRNRFLLAVSGTYGHALHARREAARLGDPPRTLGSESSALAGLDLMNSSEPHRMYDDLVVLDAAGRCVGMVRIGDLVRGVAEMNIEQAAALHPLTRLPGSDMIAELVDRKVAGAEMFAVSWLDVDDFGAVNDNGGFTAGDDLIQELGRALTDAAKTAATASIAHLGGDDFLVVCDLDDVMPIGSAVLDEPWEVEGQQIALSLASLVCPPGTVAGHRDVSRMLAQLRRHAKTMSGTSWLFGRAGSEQMDVLRGGRTEKVRGVTAAEPQPLPDRPMRNLDWDPQERRTG